jgi:hypothetical protein
MSAVGQKRSSASDAHDVSSSLVSGHSERRSRTTAPGHERTSFSRRVAPSRTPTFHCAVVGFIERLSGMLAALVGFF